MTARLGRWFTVWVITWGLRLGVPPVDMLGLLAKSLPHRDGAYRIELLEDAMARNRPRV